MKLNIRVRLRSKPCLLGLLACLVTAGYSIAGMLGIELPVPQEQVLYVLGTIASILVSIGVLTDPTTPGVADSERAMGYDYPGGP